MGVTIHFEGKLKDNASYEACLSEAKDFASLRGWSSDAIPTEVRVLGRTQGNEEWEYTGETKGIEFFPHENAEPVRLELDEDLFLQEYCKTQFAPLEIHIQIAEFLRLLGRHFQTFEVFDEGEYFETNDLTLLGERLDECFAAIEEAKREDPSLEGPLRLPSGRIADLVS